MKEGLKKRLASFSAPQGALSDNESRFLFDAIQGSKGAISNREMEILRDALSDNESSFINKIIQGSKGAISNREMEILRDRLLNQGSQQPRLEDGSPLPEGMVPSPIRTLDLRDINQNGIEDRAEGIYRESDLIPESDFEPPRNIDPGFYRPIPDNFQRIGQGLKRPGPDPILEDNFPNLRPPKPSPSLQMPPLGLGENLDEEEQKELDKLLRKAEIKQMSPLSGLAEELAMQGEGEDTQLAHLRPGEIVLPPEFFDDDQFEKVVEKKFKEFDIDPEQAIVGGGIASLNPVTGLEQFGFFKKIGKSLKKLAKKIAPVAGPLANFIPGVGPVLAGAIGAGTNLAAGKGLSGALTGGLGGYGAGRLLGGIGGLGSVGGQAVGQGGFQNLGFLDKFRALGSGAQAGIGSLFGGGQQTGMMGQPQGSVTFDEASNTYRDESGNIFTADGDGNFMQVQQGQGFFRGKILDDILGFDPGGPGSGKGIYGVFPGMGQGQGQGQGGGGLGGGLGDALKLGGIGALAAGLGKLAYEDAKKQKGVALTPLTTMSPTGRYNIEAEIARRTGQQAPNPVEFGLLPEGTLPELSGGKPRAMAYGGGVYGNGLEDLQGGMASGMMMGGPVMQYAQGGAVQMQEGGELEAEDFPRMDGDINGPGTETSDDIPAMLSDGEYVMTGRAVRGAGSYDVSNNNGILSLTPSMEEDRERGMQNMYQLMDFFENSAQPSS